MQPRRLLAASAFLALAACHSMNSTQSNSAVAGVGASPAPHARSASVFPYPVERHTLANGLEVRFIPMASGGLVSYWSIVRTGSRDEVEAGVTGFAHFFEHMMFRGSKRFPQFDEIVNGIGADSNAYTTDDYTAYHLGFAKEDLSTVIEVEADRFQNLDYSKDQFQTESGAVYGEYRKGRTQPFEVLFEAVQNAAFDQHTYKHTTIGFEADIQRMKEQYDYSKSFFQRFYRPENVVVVVAGDFDAKAALAKIEKEYAPWKKGYTAPAVPKEPPQTAQRRITVPFDGKTLPTLAINWKGDALKPNDKTMMAATLFGELAFGETSSIYEKLVLDEQKVEALDSGFGYNRDPGLWSVFALVKDMKDVAAVESEIWNSVANLQKVPVDAKRLNDVRSRLKYAFLSGLSTPNQVCGALAQLVAITGDLDCIEQMYATLDAVTPFDVQAAASLYLKPERSTVALLHTAGQTVPSFSTRMVTPTDRDGQVVAYQSTTFFGAFEFADPTLPSMPLPPADGLSQKPVLMPVASDPNVAFKLWFQVGSQDDAPGKEGLAALTAAMITEAGTAAREYQQILEALFPLAAGYGNSVDKEMTILSGRAHKDVADRFAELFLDAVVHPGFRESDFTRLRDQMVSGIENELRYSSDEELGKATLVQSVFAGSRYAHIDEGTVASLKALTLDDVKGFYKTNFTRDNVVVGLGGAYSKELQQKVESTLATLPAGKPTHPKTKVGGPKGLNVTLVEKPGASTAISFGCPIDLARGSREFYALWIANSWLGEHRNSVSHLYQVIREARGMNYGDYSYIEAYPNGGRRNTPPSGVGRHMQMFEVWVRPVPRENALFALRAALREVDTLAKNGLTKEQFDYQRKFLKNYCLHFAETTADRLGWALDDRFFGTEKNGGHLATFRKMMDDITLDEVNAAIKKHLQADDLYIALVTEKAEEMKAALLSGAPSPITYPDGTTQPPAQLEEDKVIQSYPLKLQPANVRILPVDQMFAGAKANG
ncbi:MAG: insulinase family protein [Planctomycetes bacterium]|nr:insulinase family protein [Planctomycetota bacterium]